jgi:lysyl-tRNA synthetase class 2
VCKNFRNEDVDKTHNPEFTMLEFYAAYHELEDMMVLLEQMVESIALKVIGTTKIQYEGKEIDLKAPWPRITMFDALKKYANLDVTKMNDEEMLALCRKEGIEINADEQKHGLIIAALFEHFCEPFLTSPIFITEHPRETTPLCKLSRNNPSLVERCEPFINSWELGNGYSELNDPILQRQLFEEQKDQGRAKGENHPIDEDFLEAVGYGMPPTGGMGFGVDRIVMLLTGASTIRDVIFFPQMRPEKEAQK